jgi:DNA-binding PadR family transcriptional regulator
MNIVQAINDWLRRRLYRSRLRVLRCVARGEKTAADVMRDTGLSSGTAYAVLYVAQERGLVKLRVDPPVREGGFSRYVYTITDAGRDAIKEMES